MSIAKWFKNLKFQPKLVAGYLVLALIPMLGGTAYNYSRTRSILLEQSYRYMEEETEQIEHNFSVLMEPYRTILDILYVDQALSGYLFEDYSNDSYEEMFYYIDNQISGIRAINPEIQAIRFYSSNETLPADNYYFFSTDDLSDKNEKKAEQAKGEIVLAGGNSPQGEFRLSLERILNFFAQGNLKSVISLEISSEWLGNLLEPGNETDFICLADADGTILAASEEESAGKNVRLRFPEWKNDGEGELTEFILNGKEQIGTAKELAFGTYLVVISDKAELLKEATQMSGSMMRLILLSAAVALILIIAFTRWISGRVNKVVYAAKRLGDGAFDYVLEDMGGDEIGQIGTAFNILNFRIQKLIRDNYEKKIKLQASEVNLMQEQISPHFLYNALSVISVIALREGGKRTVQSVKNLADFYRISLNKGRQVLSVGEEVELLQDYMRIQEMRFGDSVQISYDVNSGVLPMRTIKLLLQPLVENAIHHGRRSEEEVLHITVRVFPEGENICFQVSDDGIGIEPEKLRTLRKELGNYEEGYGLKNVDNRVKLTYGENYGVEIDSSYGEGTTVRVFIPQITK